MRPITTLLLPLIILGLLAWPAPARAADELGYFWSLELDFENNFDGVLTIKVGPWKNGGLDSVDAISSERVRCAPIGAVALNGGDAVFTGGHVECRLDIAGALLRNHGMVVDKVDSYAGIMLHTDLESTAQNLAPIVSHPDATYTIDFSNTWSVTMAQTLDNTLGTQSVMLYPVTGALRQDYAFEYGCVWLGPCHGIFEAGGEGHITPAGGAWLNFRTGPTTLRIGGDGVTSFSGRMGNLLIDPGNSVH